MTACWKCNVEVDAVSSPRCPSCKALQPLPANVSHFAVLGLPESFLTTENAIESAYRTRSAQVHPDRFARAEAKERRISVERTAAVNDAYRVLKHAESRAAYLLARVGLKLDEKKADPATLMELMEAREWADESPENKASLLAKTRTEHAELLRGLESQFGDVEKRGELGKRDALEPVLTTLTRLRYLGRLLEDLQGIREHTSPLIH